MVDRYPHTASVSFFNEATTESNGDLITGSADTDYSFVCRLEPASRAEIKTTDGEHVLFAWVVYCSKTTMLLPEGALLTVTEKTGVVLASNRIKQFAKGQLNCRIWL